MKATQIATIFTCALLSISCHAATPNLQQSILSTHNEFRSEHSAPDLVWDNTLADYAQHHASQCVFNHSHGPYGENLAAGYPTPEDAVFAWYSEQQYYSYSAPQFSSKTGHFTQVVWKSTRKIGCALVACNGLHGTPGNYLVCEYDPPGNITNVGYFSNNVLPISASKAKA